MKTQQRINLIFVLATMLSIVMPSIAANDKLTKAQNIHAGWSSTYIALEKGLPRLYRDQLSNYKASLELLGGSSPDLKNKLDATGLIKSLSDCVKYANSIFGIGKEIALGNAEKAAFKTTMFAITEAAGTSSGKAALKAIGVSSTLYIAGVVTAMEIAYESHLQATEWTNATQMESLLGGIEMMFPMTNANVEKMPVTPENVDKVWQRILSDKDFRKRFEIYVTETLQRSWPAEPPIPFREKFDPPFTQQDKEKLLRDSLLARQDEIKQYIAGILSELNNKFKAQSKAVKDRQAAMIMIKDLEAKIKLLQDNSIEEFSKKYSEAYQRLQKAKAFAETIPIYVPQAVRENDDGTLDVHLNIMTNYISTCLIWLPDDGQVGVEKREVIKVFQTYFDYAARNSDRIKLIKKVAPRLLKAGQPGEGIPPAEGNASVDFSDMIAMADKAWVDLNDNKLDGAGYISAINLAREGSSIKANEALEPFRKKIQDAADRYNEENQGIVRQINAAAEILSQEDKDPNNFYWNPYVGMIRKSTPGMQRYQQCVLDSRAAYGRWQTISNKLNADLGEASKKIWEECNKALALIEKQKKDRFNIEEEALDAFITKFNQWEESPIIIQYMYLYNSQIAETKNYQLKMLGHSGDSLASFVLKSQSLYIKNLIDGMSIPVSGTIVGAKVRHEERLEELRKADGIITQVIAAINTSDNQARELASEAFDLAALLEPKVEVWAYVRSYSQKTSTYNIDFRDNLPRLKDYREKYLAARENYLSEITAMNKERDELLNKMVKATGAMSKENDIIDTGKKILLNIKLTSDGLHTSLDMDGKSQLATLAANGITAKAIYEMEELIVEFASKEKLNAYVLTLIPGEKEYNPAIRPVVSPVIIEILRKNAKSRMAAVAANRDAYETAYKDFYNASNTLDAILKSLQVELKDAHPTLLSMLERKNILLAVYQNYMKELALNIDYVNFYPPDPANFTDPNYGVMERLDKYEKLSEKYHSFIDPELKKIARNHRTETRLLNEMADRIEREGLGWMSLGGNEFAKKCNEISHEAWMIITPISISGEAEIGSPVLTAYNRVISTIINFSSKYYAAEALKALIADLSAITNGVKQFLINPANGGGATTATGWIKALQKYTDPTSTAMKMKSSDATLAELMTEVNREIPLLQQVVDAENKNKMDSIITDIKAFYDQFKKAYESKNDSKVISYISDKWISNDGTTLDELQEYLQQSFRVFDEIRYTLANMKVEQIDEGKFKVSYDLVITGRIFKNNIKHEEKSSVVEELQINDKGKYLIIRNLDGRFWSVE